MSINYVVTKKVDKTKRRSKSTLLCYHKGYAKKAC